MSTFSYDAAFDRNIGWVTAGEQQVLRSRRVAIAGLGGVGGAHLLALVRLGVGRFSLAEFDTFDVVNFNRQVGATWDSVGRPKLDVMVEMARGINPESLLSTFPAGVSAATVDQFLDGADLFVDGLDFFAVAVRRLVFARCAALGIPAITAAPIGMGAGYLVFVPGGMSFETYFRLEGVSESEQFLALPHGHGAAGGASRLSGGPEPGGPRGTAGAVDGGGMPALRRGRRGGRDPAPAASGRGSGGAVAPSVRRLCGAVGAHPGLGGQRGADAALAARGRTPGVSEGPRAAGGRRAAQPDRDRAGGRALGAERGQRATLALRNHGSAVRHGAFHGRADDALRISRRGADVARGRGTGWRRS